MYDLYGIGIVFMDMRHVLLCLWLMICNPINVNVIIIWLCIRCDIWYVKQVAYKLKLSVIFNPEITLRHVK
jgi:hypothetical protein